MTELVTFGETPIRFSPPANQRFEQARQMSIYADGTESNVACAAQELGIESTWLSKLPRTPLGRMVVSQIGAQGVDTDVTWVDGTEYRQGLVFGETANPPRKSQYWHDRGNTAAAAASPSDLPMDLVQNASVVFSGLSTPVLSTAASETTQALVRAASGSGATTVVDLDYAPGLAAAQAYRNAFDALSPNVDVFIANEDDVRDVLGYTGGARELANIIVSENDLEVVVITRSKFGAVAMHDSPGTNLIHERDAVDATPVDRTGQHGAFVGAFLSELARDSEVADALTSAVAAAGIAQSLDGPFLSTHEGELEAVVDALTDRV